MVNCCQCRVCGQLITTFRTLQTTGYKYMHFIVPIQICSCKLDFSHQHHFGASEQQELCWHIMQTFLIRQPRTLRAGGCLVVIELSGRALAAQGRCPGFDSQRLLSFSLSSIFSLITSKFSLFQHEARVISRGKSLEHAFLKKVQGLDSQAIAILHFLGMCVSSLQISNSRAYNT